MSGGHAERKGEAMGYLESLPERTDLWDVIRAREDAWGFILSASERIMQGPSSLSRAERELLGAYVSGLNACGFCSGEHEAVAERFDVIPGTLTALLADIESAPISDELRPAFRFLHKLTLHPSRMTASDADAIYAVGWEDPALYHLASICALFSFDNRLIQGIGIEPHEPGKLQATADRLYERGYASTVDFIRDE